LFRMNFSTPVRTNSRSSLSGIPECSGADRTCFSRGGRGIAFRRRGAGRRRAGALMDSGLPECGFVQRREDYNSEE
jgi:hypothetical protein